jgi:hypothetical protein
MPRTSAFLAAAVIAACLATPARAAETELVLRGSRTASTVLHLTRPVRLLAHDADGRVLIKVTAKGDLAGFSIAEQSGRVLLADVTSSRVTWSRMRTVNKGSFDGVLRPGRYVLTIVASGVTEVRIPVSGLPRTAEYRPTTAVPVHVVERPVGDAVAGYSVQSAGRMPVRVGPRTLVWFGVGWRQTGLNDETQLCIAPPGKGCPGHCSFDSGYHRYDVPIVDQETGAALMALPGVVPPGDRDLVWDVSVDVFATSMRAVAVTIG